MELEYNAFCNGAPQCSFLFHIILKFLLAHGYQVSSKNWTTPLVAIKYIQLLKDLLMSMKLNTLRPFILLYDLVLFVSSSP